MKEKRLMTMNIASNILNAYYTSMNSYCSVYQREPEDQIKEELLQRVLSVFENLCTSYIDDIEDIAESIRTHVGV